MRIEFTETNRVYVTNKPKEYVQKVPIKKHRLKNGRGTCSFTMAEFYEFEKNQTHILLVDMSLRQALLFSKADVLPTVIKTEYCGAPLYVANLKQLYLSGQYQVAGAL